MAIALVEMQSEIALIDMKQIQNALTVVQEDLEALQEYVRNPDGYMHKVVSLSGMPSIHFHVQVEGALYPKEPAAEPMNQVVFTAVIEVAKENKSNILALLEHGTPSLGALDACETCTRCQVSIIKWV